MGCCVGLGLSGATVKGKSVLPGGREPGSSSSCLGLCYCVSEQGYDWHFIENNLCDRLSQAL